jgi:hypothetical protein
LNIDFGELKSDERLVFHYFYEHYAILPIMLFLADSKMTKSEKNGGLSIKMSDFPDRFTATPVFLKET